MGLVIRNTGGFAKLLNVLAVSIGIQRLSVKLENIGSSRIKDKSTPEYGQCFRLDRNFSLSVRTVSLGSVNYHEM